MTLPGQEDFLLFQKKTSDLDMKKLAPMKLLHKTGDAIDFHGIKLEDAKPFINRFLYKPGKDPVVVIQFDNLKQHQYWRCSCGGSSIPYYTCLHLQTLKIVPNVDEAILILTHEEYNHFHDNVLSETFTFPDTEPFIEIPMGVSKAPETSVNVPDFFPYKESEKYTYLCPDCKKPFQSDSLFASCPSCPMAEMQFEAFVPSPPVEIGTDLQGNPIYISENKDSAMFLDPDYFDLDHNGLPISKKKKKGKMTVSYRDWDHKDDFKPQEIPEIPKVKGKRLFADKDEEV